jgi:hypothetical protein
MHSNPTSQDWPRVPGRLILGAVLLVSGWTDSSDFPVVDAAQPVKDNRR